MRRSLSLAAILSMLASTPAEAQTGRRVNSQTIVALDDAIADLSSLNSQIAAARARRDSPAALNANGPRPTNPCAGVTVPSWRACAQQVDGKVRRMGINVSAARAIQSDLGSLQFSLGDARSGYDQWLAALRRALQKLQEERDDSRRNWQG